MCAGGESTRAAFRYVLDPSIFGGATIGDTARDKHGTFGDTTIPRVPNIPIVALVHPPPSASL